MPAPTARDDDSSDSDTDLEVVDIHGAARRLSRRLSCPGWPPFDQGTVLRHSGALQATIIRLERKIVSEEAFPGARKRGEGVRGYCRDCLEDIAARQVSHPPDSPHHRASVRFPAS